jgi:hypothetical protein
MISLKELQAMFPSEAAKYQVLSLDVSVLPRRGTDVRPDFNWNKPVTSTDEVLCALSQRERCHNESQAQEDCPNIYQHVLIPFRKRERGIANIAGRAALYPTQPFAGNQYARGTTGLT